MLLALLPLQAAIALTPNAMRMDALLRELTQKSGVVHRATGDLAGRIMLTVGKPRPVAEIREDLATANWAQWKNVGGEWRIELDREAIKKRDATRQALRIASFEKVLQGFRESAVKPFDAAAAKLLLKRLDSLPANEDLGQDHDKYEAIQKDMPSTAALKRIFAAMRAEDLAAIPKGRVVFSDRPTALQKPLPNVATAAVRQLERDQNVWASVYTDEEGFRTGRRSWYGSDPRGSSSPAAANSLRLVMVTTFDANYVSASAYFVDRTRRVVQFGNLSFNVSSSPPRTSAPPLEPNEKPLPIEAAAKVQELALNGKGTEEARKRLANPQKFEPLDGYPAAVVRGISNERKANATIWLDDNLLTFATGHRVDDKRSNTASEWIRQLWIRGYNLDAKPGRYVFRPRGDATNVDRLPLTNVLRSLDQNGYFPLNELADYAATQPALSLIMYILIDGVVPGSSAFMDRDWDELRAWAWLSPSQRQMALASGQGTIPIRDLPKGVQEAIVTRLMSEESYRFETKNPSRYMSLDSEPTELLANGFRLDTVLQFDTARRPAICIEDQNDTMYRTAYVDADRLARALKYREREPGKRQMDGLPLNVNLDRVRYGFNVKFEFTIDLTPDLTWRIYAEHPEFDARQKPGPMPSDFKQEFDRATQRFGGTPVP